MSEFQNSIKLEVVRGGLTGVRADQILRFWARHGGWRGEAARKRLADVVCVRLDEAGDVNGVNSVHAGALELLGGLRLWVYRSLLPSADGNDEADADAMLAAAFAALDTAFDPDGTDPAGLCALLSPAEASRRPQAEWPDPPMLHAGFSADGRQIRIAWFAGARIDGMIAHG